MANTTKPLPLSIPVKPAQGKRKVKKARRVKTPPTMLKVMLTIIIGVGIPLLSLALAKLAGTLAAAQMYALSLLAFALMIAVLSVSLKHLAWSITDITRSPPKASWAMAISLDLSLVLCELIHVYANTLGLDMVANAVMICVALTSMALNVWAFLMPD
jgi:hypothetical protein